jgi:hypothetical protein
MVNISYRVLVSLLCGLCFVLVKPASAEVMVAGMVKTYQPIATVIRPGDTAEQSVAIGAKLYVGDIVITHSDATVGIIFLDGSVLSLGPDSQIEISDFMFKPEEKQVSFISKVSQGTVAFTSGAIGRIAPESVKFITPESTLTLHGTKVLIEVK